MKINEKFLESYLNSNSPTGFEYELGGQKLWMENIAKFVDKVEIDNYGTAYGITGNMDSEFKVVIEAHADEISWLVNYIDSKGYIKVIKNGGSDATIAPSMRVTLWGENGPVDGIFGHPAIHIHYRKKEVDLDSIFIDVGASNKQEVIDMGINVGTVATFTDGFMKLGKDYYTGRALDNRIGGFMIAEVARKLKEKGKKLKRRYELIFPIPYARRIVWYALVRIFKPNVVVESGTEKGLGSLIINRALEKNGIGQLHTLDIDIYAGSLFDDQDKEKTQFIEELYKTLNV
jgi:putative aminopeptidase FrvX